MAAATVERLQGVRAVFNYDKWKLDARSDAYATPCGRYSVERTGTERFEVYGPDRKIVDWFTKLPDAKECADGQAERA